MFKSAFSIILILFVSMVTAQDECSNLYLDVDNLNGKIYFSSNRTGNYEIFRTNMDGSQMEQLTNSSDTDEFYPAISPDGSKVLYQKGQYKYGDIWIMNADGSDKKVLKSAAGHEGYPNWSPDGLKIVYEAWDGSTYPEIFTMNVDGSNAVQLTNSPGAYWNSGPVFSPSGDMIYFQKGFNADNYYVRMDLQGTLLDTITPQNTFGFTDFGLNFSPDGSKIVFSTTEFRGYNKGSDVVIADPDGSNWERITTSEDYEYSYFPCFYTDTNQVLFSYNQDNRTSSFSLKLLNRASATSQKVSNCWNVGVDNVEKQWACYPNPTNGILYLAIPEIKEELTIQVLDLRGVLKHSFPIQANQEEIAIDISALRNGVYLVKLASSEYAAAERVILCR